MGPAQAMFEGMRYEDGALLNGEALEYRVPMAEDLPARFVSRARTRRSARCTA